MIGSDETLKGDTFGGIVVAAVLIPDDTIDSLGIRDSKTISDMKIPILAQKIKDTYTYAVRSLFPVEYNQYKQTELLNILHKQVADEIQTKPRQIHVVDQYPGCQVGDIIETKAESKYLCVAAASIIARDEGLKQIEKLTQQAGFIIPKGSTHVSEALQQLKDSGLNPHLFVKLHFKNVQKFFDK